MYKPHNEIIATGIPPSTWGHYFSFSKTGDRYLLLMIHSRLIYIYHKIYLKKNLFPCDFLNFSLGVIYYQWNRFNHVTADYDKAYK